MALYTACRDGCGTLHTESHSVPELGREGAILLNRQRFAIPVDVRENMITRESEVTGRGLCGGDCGFGGWGNVHRYDNGHNRGDGRCVVAGERKD